MQGDALRAHAHDDNDDDDEMGQARVFAPLFKLQLPPPLPVIKEVAKIDVICFHIGTLRKKQRVHNKKKTRGLIHTHTHAQKLD
jgi:hypothetical protein